MAAKHNILPCESGWIINFCKCNLEKWGNDKMSAKIGIPFQRVSTIFLTILSKCHNIYFIHTYKYVGTII